MAERFDPDRQKLFKFDDGMVSVGATATEVLASVTIADGECFRLVGCQVDFSGASLLSASRGLIVQASESGGTVSLARAAGDGSTLAPTAHGVVYENTDGGPVTLELLGFHGDSVAHDMVGHLSWEEIAV